MPELSIRPKFRLRALARYPFVGLVPPTGPARFLVGAATIDSAGTGLFAAIATIYFIKGGILSPIEVASALSIAGIFGVAGPVPLGWLADRFGVRRIYILLVLLRGLGYCCYAGVSSYPQYLVLACFLAAVDRACSPLLQALVAGVVPADARMSTLASIRSFRNIGLTAGFLVASLIILVQNEVLIRTAFIVNGLSFLLMAVIVYLRAPVVVLAVETTPAAEKLSILRNWRFALLAVGNSAATLHDTLLTVVIPIWIVANDVLPDSLLPVLFALNTVMTVLLQVPISRRFSGARGGIRLIVRAAALLILTCVGLGFTDAADTVWVAVALAVTTIGLLTIGENMHAVAAWDLSYAMSPAHARARYLSIFSSVANVQTIVGPALLVGILLPLGSSGWAVLGAIFAAGCAAMYVAARKYSARE